MINWKIIIIGLVSAKILSFVLGIVLGLWSILGYFLAMVYVGYVVGGDYRNGAVHGAIVGVMLGIFNLLILIYNGVFASGFSFLLISLILGVLIFNSIIGAIVGVLGVFIKKIKMNKGK